MAGDGGQMEKSWIVNIDELLRQEGSVYPLLEAERWQKHSIYRVPADVKNDRKVTPYEPLMVSLGPFYHGNGKGNVNGNLALVAMEEHKKRALLHLVRRTGRPVRDLVKALKEVLPQLLDAYMDLDDEIGRASCRERVYVLV